MSLISLRLLPKNSFISLIIPHIQTFHNDIGFVADKNITLNNNKFTLNSKSTYHYTINELNKTSIFYTHISSLINKKRFDIHEKITIKNNSNDRRLDNYINYSVNIVDISQPIIYSIKCINQPIAFDLMKHYTDDIIKVYKNFI
jgi:hypothetical protein